jgi:hypothetical protein
LTKFVDWNSEMCVNSHSSFTKRGKHLTERQAFMTTMVETAPVSSKLRALDPSLPMLAARAAMELDNYKLTGEVSFEAVKHLCLRLRNSFAINGGGGAKALLDSSTVSIVGYALNSSNWAGQISTIDQLGNKLQEIAEGLEGAESTPANAPIEKMRDFCVALSKSAASYRQAFNDLRPSHPFQR